jgi:hypothetical protein
MSSREEYCILEIEYFIDWKNKADFIRLQDGGKKIQKRVKLPGLNPPGQRK